MNSRASTENIIKKKKKSTTYQYLNREGLLTETLQVRRHKCETQSLWGVVSGVGWAIHWDCAPEMPRAA